MKIRRAQRTQRTLRVLPAALALSVCLAVTGCGAGSAGGEAGDGGDSASSNDGGDDAAPETGDQTFQVLAAASLTDVFDDLADTFEDQHDGVEVEASYGSSTDLAEQAADGAPGDVLATADETSMQVAEDAGVTGDVTTFATNTLVIVVPPGNPGGVSTLADLADVDWVRCADEVPCGRVAQAVLQDNDVTAEPVSLEEDVRATLEKVESGEAEAGLVYASDAVAAGDDVESIEIPGSEAQETSYFVAPLTQSEDVDLAADWAALLTSEDGRRVLEDAGFTLP